MRILLATAVFVALLSPWTAAVGPVPPRPDAAAMQAGSNEPMPIDLAFARRALTFSDRPVLTRDGARIAYVVRTPPVQSPPVDRFLPGGVPADVPGSRVFVTETATSVTQAVAAEAGNCWRPSFSSDGRHLACYCDAGGTPQLWAYDVASHVSRRVTDAPMKAKLWAGDEPLWSPDGRLIYVPLAPPQGPIKDTTTAAAKPDGPRVTVYRSSADTPADRRDEQNNEAMRAFYMAENNAAVAAVDLASGTVRILVPANASPPPSVLRVSPSGRWVAYLSVFNKPRALETTTSHDLSVVPASGGSVSVLAHDVTVPEDLNYYLGTYLWHPTRDQVFWVNGEQIWMATLGAASITPTLLAADLKGVAPAPLGFTRDGQNLLVTTKAGALAVVPVAGGSPRVIPMPQGMIFRSLIRQDALTAWQPVANTLTLVARESATADDAVLRTDLASGRVTVLWKGLARLRIVGAPADHGWLAASVEDMNNPDNLYRFDENFGNRHQLTDIEPRLAGVKFGPVETFETRVPLYDGRLGTVTTAVLLPPGRKRGDCLPALVFIYPGGKVSRAAAEYGGGMPSTVPVSAFTTRGYAVLLSELPIGPEGQAGQPLAEMIDLLVPQVYRAAELGYVDIDRVAVSGQSYGGYGTAAVLTGTNLFRAGIAISGLYDLPSWHSRMDESGTAFSARWSETGQGRMGTHPWGDLRRYLENSPYYQADRIHTPLLMLHGEVDSLGTVEDAKKMFNALRRLGRTAELAVYAGEGHVVEGWSLANAVDATTRMLAFLDAHLKR